MGSFIYVVDQRERKKSHWKSFFNTFYPTVMLKTLSALRERKSKMVNDTWFDLRER